MAKHAATPINPFAYAITPFFLFFRELLRACVLRRNVGPNFFRSFQAMTGI